ncbi:MAG TPA: RNA polymerase sigma factor [Bacteroidia bacterium]|nr:RNA polymerase sigma factor [Sphingobacteriales bacterium]HPD65956.1 RNA polymerase sigma factor [Bacteroidia bacterium]HRS59623.1 RNA polymerase sigma factor [Bacteroidia bacterium]HRU68231.1 RNA polymerase sigma factor [Bacteroidia bacterium]
MDNEKVNKEEFQLVQQCIKGNHLAQQKLFKKYYSLMLGVCLRYANNREDAKEILQEGFIKIFRHLETFKFEGTLISWMKKIMVNTAIDKYRKKITEPEQISLENTNESDPAEDMLSRLTTEDLLNCINQLPLGYRTIFNLYVIEGYSHKEIGEKLGISEGTSKSQLFKAKQSLQEMIKKMFS